MVVNWNDIVPKNYQDIPCGFFSCCSKSENQYLKDKNQEKITLIEEDKDNMDNYFL